MSKNTEQAEQKELQKQVETVLAEKGEIVYNVAGEEVKLSFPIVRKFLVRGNSDKVTDADLVQFISLCRYNQLNPFLKEAYLIKYGDDAQMITSKEAFLKRAEAHPDYEGFKAGIIVLRDKAVVEEEGSFSLPGDELVGGWAEVHRKDRKFPIKSRVSLREYDKKQSVWNSSKGTMIRKVPLVQALREAFPTQLGAMYTEDEMVIDVDHTDMTQKVRDAAGKAKDRQTISIDPKPAMPTDSKGNPVDPDTGEVTQKETPPARPKANQKQEPEPAAKQEAPAPSGSDDDDLPDLDND